jgi:hypothetical protein
MRNHALQMLKTPLKISKLRFGDHGVPLVAYLVLAIPNGLKPVERF